MNMIDVLQRLAELDAKNPNVIKENTAPTQPAGAAHYDLETKIINPAYIAWENGTGDENNPPPEEIDVGVNYSIYSDSDERGSFSNIDEYKVYDLTTGQELDISDKNILDDIEDAIWRDAESSKDDDFDIPDRDDFYESAEPQLDECGMMPDMGMTTMDKPHTPATINMTAASGPELSGMLRDIMQLAGINQPAAPAPMSATPQVLEPTDDMSPADSMRSVIDKMNPDADQDADSDTVNQAQGDLDDDGDHDMDDHGLEKKEPVDEYDNTPADPNKKNPFDANQYAHRENQPGQGDRMDGDRPKAYADMNEAVADLFAQYKRFVSEN